jgi:hypothetical protein
LGTAFFVTVIFAPSGAAVSCQLTVYTKILTPSMIVIKWRPSVSLNQPLVVELFFAYSVG